MSFPRYPAYKPSGVEWLGEVPTHWEVMRLGSIFRPVDEPGTDELSILSVSIHDGVSDKELDEKEMDRKVTRSEDRSKYKSVLPGDLVYNMMRAWQGGFGAVTVPGMVSPAYVVARPTTTFSTSFIEGLLRTPQAIEQMRRYSQGVTDFRLRLYWEEFKTIRVTLPPPAEQSAIAAFLDRETGKIDALVAEQRRLMELLKEKRQAVISHAVTRGLNPKAKLKPSGIEWIGEVPEHWEVKRTKYVVMKGDGIQMGPFGGMLLDLDGEDTGFKVYGQENTISGDFTRGGRWLSEERFRALSNYHVDIGDLLLTRKGSLGNARLVLELPQPGIADSDTIRVRVDKRLILPTFLALLFHEAGYITQQINLAKRGAILAGLNSETIANIAIILPPIEQQKEVMAHLDRELAKFDTLTAEAQRAIDLLQERRTALISAAVTGQIDVRHFSNR